MKRIAASLLALLMLTGCGGRTVAEVTESTAVPEAVQPSKAEQTQVQPRPYAPRFPKSTYITLSDEGITVEGNQEAVTTSNDIIYYEDKDTYESGNPYGEGTDADKHTAEEAAAHTVVNITQPGAYTVSGSLSAGQLRIDLGDDAYEDPDAVVELTLKDAQITCTVAPAILFLNTYECDGDWSEDDAKPDVDTSEAGANLILQGENKVSGGYVAKIFKDKDGEKKLWKQDAAIYSYMSMNVWGEGALELTAENEGLGTELHLTINSGDIAIYSDNDGINTNEDNVSVTTINGGDLRIVAGLGKEGDGIDSNGYLVINGGTVVSSANPASDAGLDSDLGSFIHGGTVIALGSTMDWAESASGQVTMNLQFADYQPGSSAILVTDENETPVFAYDPSEDEGLAGNLRQYQGAIVSCPAFTQGATYHLYSDGTIAGEETGGIYSSISSYEGGTRMQYSGTDVGGRPGGRGGMMGQRPEGQLPEDFQPGQPPEGMTLPDDFQPGQPPEDFPLPEGETMPAGFDPSDFDHQGQRPEWGNRQEMPSPAGSTVFYMNDMVNAFNGIQMASGE